MNRSEDESRRLGERGIEGNGKIDSKIVENYQGMSNLQQGSSSLVSSSSSVENYQSNHAKAQ